LWFLWIDCLRGGHAHTYGGANFYVFLYAELGRQVDDPAWRISGYREALNMRVRHVSLPVLFGGQAQTHRAGGYNRYFVYPELRL
jgi:hypothetical protein